MLIINAIYWKRFHQKDLYHLAVSKSMTKVDFKKSFGYMGCQEFQCILDMSWIWQSGKYSKKTRNLRDKYGKDIKYSKVTLKDFMDVINQYCKGFMEVRSIKDKRDIKDIKRYL